MSNHVEQSKNIPAREQKAGAPEVRVEKWPGEEWRVKGDHVGLWLIITT